MDEDVFNIDAFIIDNGTLNLPENIYRKYKKELIVNSIIDKIQSGEIVFPDPPLFCSQKFKEDAFQKLKQYEPEFVKRRHSNYQQKLSREIWQKMNLAVDGYKSDYLYINTQSSDYDIDKVIDCFTGLQRMKCKREGRDLSPFTAWNNQDYMKFVIERYMDDKENLTSFNLRESFYKLNSVFPEKYRNMECNFFKATLAASVYDLFLRNKPHKRVLDISAGWGDRLLAALSKNLESYLAYDPNTALQSGYKDMIDEFIPDEKEKEHYQVVGAPFETAESNLRGKTFDLIFTSPPYFDLEVFTTEGEQSIISHSSFDKWMVHFLFQSLYLAWDTLAADGNMVIHIDDFSKGDKKHRIIEPMVLFVCGWCNNARFDGVVGASGYNKKKEYKSPMWVFKHKTSVKDEVDFCREKLKEKYPELYDLILKNKLKFGQQEQEQLESIATSSRNIELGQSEYDFKGKLCVIQGNKYNIHTKKGFTDFYIQLEHVLKRVGFTVKLLDDDFISSIQKIQLDHGDMDMEGGAKKGSGSDPAEKKESRRKRMERVRSKIAAPVERDPYAQEELEELELPRVSFQEAQQQQKERERIEEEEEEKQDKEGFLKSLEEQDEDEEEEEQARLEEAYDEPAPIEVESTPLPPAVEKNKKRKVDLLLNFEDLFIDKSVPRFFSGMNLAEAFTFYKNLESKGTVMYPPADFVYYTNSKMYSADLHASPEYAEFVLPKSKTFLFPYHDNGALNQVWREMTTYFKRMQDETDYIVVKSGFSADMNDVYLVITPKAESEQQFPKELDRAFPKDKRFILDENISELRDFIFDFIRENNVDLVMIAEPYNKIVSQRKNEYRMWYLGGKFVDYFCFGIERDENQRIKLIDNQAFNEKNELHVHLKTLTDKLYQVVLQKIRSLLKNDEFVPVAMRFDMSYATDTLFLDKHAVTIKQKGNLRFYCNEIENIDGTFYTNIPVLDVNGHKTSLAKTFEKNLISILTSTAFQGMSLSKRAQTDLEMTAILNVIRKFTLKPPPSACNGVQLKKIHFTFGTSKPREIERKIDLPEQEQEKEIPSQDVQLIMSQEPQEEEPSEASAEETVEMQEEEREKEPEVVEKEKPPAKKIRVKIIKPGASTAAAVSAAASKKGKKDSEGRSSAAVAGVDPTTVFGSLALKERISPPPEKIVASPYFMNNRKIFVDFINKFFLTKFKDTSEKGAPITCEEIKKSKTDSARLSLFPHQQIVKDYLNMYTPYRGLLLFHGLGSGKTCSSIAIAEGLKTEKQIIIMTPASLQVNYRNDLKKCGDEFYKRNQHWEFISIREVPESERSAKIAQLSAVLNISSDMIKENGGAWMINVKNTKNNFPDLSTEERQQLEAQLDVMIEAKYKFINYNGLNRNKIAELTNNGKTNPFDNAVVIIDEAHRIVNSISNQLKNLKPTKSDEKKAKALISIQLYKYLQNADNAKIILLTGTPIINYPNELAILFNILRGYIKTWSFKLTVDKDQRFDESSIVAMLKKYNIANYDYVKYTPSTQTMTITRNPFGFTDASKGASASAYAGVIRAPAGDESNEEFLQKIKKMFASEQIRSEDPVITNFTALPDNFEDFKTKFLKINPDTFEIVGVKELPLFQRRILGLVSYFKSAQEQLMPRLLDIKLELVPMSNMQYSEYVDVRTDEITKTKRAQKNKNMYEVSSNSYRIFSRLCCNFVFPPANEMDGRPGRPKKEKLNEQNVDVVTEQDVRQRQATFVEGVEEDAPLEVISGDSSYNEKIRELFQYYETHDDDLKASSEGGRLNDYSPKFLKMLQNISSVDNKGLHLIYSQFRSLEGIGMFSLVLNANGFTQFKIKKEGDSWAMDIAAEDEDKPTYALYTGTEDADEKEIVRNIFNSDFSSTPENIKQYLEKKKKTKSLSNMYGEFVRVFMITASGSEGINLRNVRFVHIMEPYWNGVRVEQVIGRAQRICSHEDLPEDEKTVQVFEYLSVFSAAQKEKLNKELKSTDSGKTTDQALFDISKKKEEISRELLNAVKTTSIDCKVHKGTKCFEFLGTPDSSAFSYVPNIELDETEKEMVANVAVEEEVFKLLPATYKGETGERLVRSMKTNNVYYKNDKFDALTSSGKPFDVKELDQYGRIEQVGDKLKLFKL